MGVKDLWDILKYGGEQVDVSEIRGKRLAIDTSIWMYELTLGHEKYNSSGEGKRELVLTSFVRRILKLLHFQVKPLFLFDGGVPMAKMNEMEVRKRTKLKKVNHKAVAKRYLDSLLKKAGSSTIPAAKKLKSDKDDDSPIDHDENLIDHDDNLIDRDDYHSSGGSIQLNSHSSYGEKVNRIASDSSSFYFLSSSSSSAAAAMQEHGTITEQASVINQISNSSINPQLQRVSFASSNGSVGKGDLSKSVSSDAVPKIPGDEQWNINASAAGSSQPLLPVNNLTSQMDEVQTDLVKVLNLFGIPFLVCPLEADSQGAYLNAAGLVDGVISNDNDILLCGGLVVYRNFFDSSKYIEVYEMARIKERLGLSRDDLIELAQLLGSDYSAGVEKVGPVLALELVAHFGKMDAFKNFLLTGADDSTIPAKIQKLRTQQFKLPVPFPDPNVYDVYVNPVVEKSVCPFEWREPGNFEAIKQLDFVRNSRVLLEEISFWEKRSKNEPSVDADDERRTRKPVHVRRSKRMEDAFSLLQSRENKND